MNWNWNIDIFFLSFIENILLNFDLPLCSSDFSTYLDHSSGVSSKFDY
jgi:hypothetical protein